VAGPHHPALRWWRGDHLVVGWVAVPGRVAGRQVVVREVRVVRVVRVVGLGRPRHPPGRMLAVVGVVGVLLDDTQQLSSAQSLPLVSVDRRPRMAPRTLQAVLHLGGETGRSVPRGGQGRARPRPGRRQSFITRRRDERPAGRDQRSPLCGGTVL